MSAERATAAKMAVRRSNSSDASAGAFANGGDTILSLLGKMAWYGVSIPFRRIACLARK